MKRVILIAVGSLKEAYCRAGVEDYVKRLKPYVNLEIVETKEFSVKKTPSGTMIHQIQEEEGKHMLEKIPEKAVAVALDQTGNSRSSQELAELIEKHMTYSPDPLVFLIGGSWGLSDQVKKRADHIISFSRLTFPHQLMRLIFLEQCYRAFTIIHHTEYHK